MELLNSMETQFRCHGNSLVLHHSRLTISRHTGQNPNAAMISAHWMAENSASIAQIIVDWRELGYMSDDKRFSAFRRRPRMTSQFGVLRIIRPFYILARLLHACILDPPSTELVGIRIYTYPTDGGSAIWTIYGNDHLATAGVRFIQLHQPRTWLRSWCDKGIRTKQNIVR